MLGISFIMASCKPNKDIYDELDSQKEPFSKDITVTLTTADYKTISDLALKKATTSADSAKAKAINTYQSFADSRPASVYLGDFLAKAYPALNKNSKAQVTYNHQTVENAFYYNPDTNINLVLSSSDYDTLHGNVAINEYFSAVDKPSSFLPTLLGIKYPNVDTNTIVAISYKYYDNPGVITERADCYYKKSLTSWAIVPNSYVLLNADYDYMGNPGPGEYDNFSSTYTPEKYLPQFMAYKFPFAQNKDEKIIIYKYYISSLKTEIRAKLFTYYDKWQENITVKTDQFFHVGSGWIFDPTVRFKMVSTDYQLIVDSDIYKDSYGTTGFYYGASAYYKNFDMRIFKRKQYEPDTYNNLSDADATTLMWQRLKEGLIIMLQKKYPAAVPQVSGVDVFYVVEFDTYNNDLSRGYWVITYKCTASANGATAPQFEVSEDYKSRI